MLYASLSNGLKMPMLGLGTWQTTAEVMESTLNAALKIGYRAVDTAILYENEPSIGKVINEWIASGRLRREDLFVSTKLPPAGMYEDRVEGFVNASLDNLRLDYVDLYLMHSPEGIRELPGDGAPAEMDREVDHAGVWRKMEEQVRLGRAKSIGVSNFSKEQIGNLLENCETKPANLQTEVHLYYQEKELVDYCKRNGISVTAYSPLGSPGISQFYQSYGVKRELPNVLQNSLVLELSKKYNKTPAQILLRHTMQRGVAVIPKSSNPLHLRENFEIFDFKLNESDLNLLNSVNVSEKVGNWESWTWV